MDWSRIDWQQLVVTVLGTGAVTTVVGIWIKSAFDDSLAKRTAILDRGTNLHQWQVERLCRLYSPLFDASNYNRRLTARATWSGEIDRGEYEKLMGAALKRAEDEFSASCLLLPRDLADQIEAFFRKMFESRVAIGGTHLIPAGGARAEAWEEVQRISHEEIPALLRGIETSARHIIQPDERVKQ